MKKWVMIFLAAVVVVALWYLVKEGIIRWQPLTMLFAALAAPFKFIWNIFDDKIKKIQEQHAAVRQRESEWTEKTSQEISEREKRVHDLNHEMLEIEVKLDLLREKKSKVGQEVGELSLEELQRQGKDAFGD